ncbi:MAG: histidinol-phosphatase HisJ family protein [Coriobacteriales bacterium]|jgi:histidinol-phosphatase (PHP family)|nr:histidinol-phosphatase HisJ family protein [Coriobacteriales bacterium]
MSGFDCHTHTYLSNHGTGTVEEVVAAAERLGMQAVALTEHLPLPAEVDRDSCFAMREDDVSTYLHDVAEARDAHPGIEVICGVEIDWRWGAEDYILKRIAPFELRLGSVHMLTDEAGNSWEFDHPDYVGGWYERGVEKVWERYLELWLQALRSAVPFDVMAHADLPKKLGFKPQFDTRELYGTMAAAVASKGCMVEVNTSGLRKPVGEMYPAPALLKAFCDAGVPCTLGSDAHVPSDVGRDFDIACALLRSAGYTHATRPTRDGDRVPVPLEELASA